jgi:hypothetical protein
MRRRSFLKFLAWLPAFAVLPLARGIPNAPQEWRRIPLPSEYPDVLTVRHIQEMRKILDRAYQPRHFIRVPREIAEMGFGVDPWRGLR